MTKLYIDIETFSREDLKAVGVYRYVEDPDWQILMAAYAFDDDPIKVLLDEDIWKLAHVLEDRTLTKVAHNAPFERINFSRMLRRDIWPSFLPPEEWHDTMVVAGVRGYPQSLKELARAVGAEDKDEATALVNFFCKPNRKGERNLPEDHPEKWLDFMMYCEQDVATLRDVDRRMGDFPVESERQIFFVDQRINDRGIRVDLGLAQKAVHVAAANQKVQIKEVQDLTGIDNPNSNPQMLKWLRTQIPEGVPNMQAETVEGLLSGDLPDDARRVLELRQELALVAQKKFQAALAGVGVDGRLRGQLRYFGAHTGRWTGRGLQIHNLPRLAFKSDLEKTAPEWMHGKRVEDMTDAAILDLLMGFGADAATLKKLVRSMFTGPLTVVDYAAIEARVIAWVAGETWALEAFYAGRDIYTETANRMSTKDNQLNRAQGKVAVLALGYNGGVGSLKAMGASGSDEELQKLVYQWRRANSHIVNLWSQLDEAFYRGGDAGLLHVKAIDKERQIILPSGRGIAYHGVRFKMEQRGGKLVRRSFFRSPQGYTTDTYGGRLAENATQAIARDILAEALVRLEKEGRRVVAHVHDEVLVEGDDLDGILKTMVRPPEWAAGMPIDGAGFVCRRYRKG